MSDELAERAEDSTPVGAQPSTEGSGAAQEVPAVPPNLASGPPKLSVGSVIGRVLETYAVAWRPLLGINLLPAAASLLIVVSPPLGLLALVVAAFFATAATIVAADAVGTGRDARISSAYRTALARAVPLLAAGLIVVLAIGALVVLLVAIGAALVLLARPIGWIAALPLGIAGTVAVYYLLTRWAPAQAVIVVEGRGPVDGLRRSWALTSRRAWKILVTILIPALATAAATGGANLLTTYAPTQVGVLALAAVTLIFGPLVPMGWTFITAELSSRYRSSLSARPTAVPSEASGDVPTSGAGPASIGRRRIALITLVALDGAFLVAGITAAAAAGGLPYDPNRGRVLFSTTSPGDSCHLEGMASDYSTTDTIYVLMIPMERLSGGERLTVAATRDGTAQGSTDLTVPAGGFGCLSFGSVSGLMPGSWTLTVTHESRLEAAGTIRVR